MSQPSEAQRPVPRASAVSMEVGKHGIAPNCLAEFAAFIFDMQMVGFDARVLPDADLESRIA